MNMTLSIRPSSISHHLAPLVAPEVLVEARNDSALAKNIREVALWIHSCVSQFFCSIASLCYGSSRTFRDHRLKELASFQVVLRLNNDQHLRYAYANLPHVCKEVITAGDRGLFERYMHATQTAEKRQLKNALIARCGRAQTFQQMLRPVDGFADGLRTARSFINSFTGCVRTVPSDFFNQRSTDTVRVYERSTQAEPSTPEAGGIDAPEVSSEPPRRPTPTERIRDLLPSWRNEPARSAASTASTTRASTPTSTTAPTRTAPTLPGTVPYRAASIPPEILAKQTEITNLRTRFDALPNPPLVPVAFACPVSLEIMTLPVFAISHPLIQQALSAPAGADRDQRIANRDLRHVLDVESMDALLGPSASRRPPCPSCRHPMASNDVVIDTELQDQILAFLRQHA